MPEFWANIGAVTISRSFYPASSYPASRTVDELRSVLGEGAIAGGAEQVCRTAMMGVSSGSVE
ncbi:hypothetical protein [Bosea sp. (in: a-proteobacteria)]